VSQKKKKKNTAAAAETFSNQSQFLFAGFCPLSQLYKQKKKKKCQIQNNNLPITIKAHHYLPEVYYNSLMIMKLTKHQNTSKSFSLLLAQITKLITKKKKK
jgi:hypothetical protein